jgi:CheY-like chemotaxis protein
VAVSCEQKGERLRIKVTDAGNGISAENIAKLFVPFERLDLGDTVVEGAGLGLSLSKHLMEAMDGRMGVESAPGEGATFWMELPLTHTAIAVPPRSVPSVPDVTELPGATARRTVLYIEDNPSNLRLVERILARRPSVNLISAVNGRLGLELARTHPPDCVLLDRDLPDVHGDEILRQLRTDPRTEDLHIVIISADASPGQAAALRAAGANDYLTKPIDVRRFLAIVDAIEPRKAEAVPGSVEHVLP